MELSLVIARIKQALTSRRYSSEADVREAIVLPVLRALGWDDLDPDRVIREYALGSRRVDYALSAFGRQPALFIEVKGPGPLAGIEKQLFEYAFHAGIQFAVLTNGQEWNFFLPAAPGSYEERLLYKLDVSERDSDEVEQRLFRYLGFDRVRSGDALRDANRDYDDLHNQRIVRDALPRAWAQILGEPDELLVDLVAERTASLCGFPPARTLVAEFLAAITGLPRREPTRQPYPAAPVLARPGAAVLPMQLPSIVDGLLNYTLEGRELTARSANEILLYVTRTLAKREPTFLERFANEARGRSRNHVAQRREDVYPGHPNLLDRVVEIVPGWHIGTNISNRDKTRLLEAACKVAGLKFGVDLVVDLPNAKA